MLFVIRYCLNNMILPEEKYELDGKEILLRSANENADDADMLIDYLKTVTGETRSLGFKECGRIPNGNKYDDGTYSDDILMVLSLRNEGRDENLE